VNEPTPREKIAKAIQLTIEQELEAVHCRGALVALAKRPNDPHRKLALDMARLGAPRFVVLPWWQGPNPDTGEKPDGATVVNRHARRKFHVEHRRKSK
jgi:hypothetical protein